MTSPTKPARYYCGNFATSSCISPAPKKRRGSRSDWSAHHRSRQARVLTGLIRADLFEQVIQQRYLGTKRFSLEGLTALIPYLDQTFVTAAAVGVTRSIIAMAHRGRLNVITNTIGRTPSETFTKFEDVDPRSVIGGGDVKYHAGATGKFASPNGQIIPPSGLEPEPS